jgi:hypothetical protein
MKSFKTHAQESVQEKKELTLIDKLEGHESEGRVLFYDSERFEVDTNDNSIYTENGTTIKSEDIDLDYLWIYEADELELEDDINDYLKSLKKVMKTIDKIGSVKKLWVMSLGEDYNLGYDYYKEDWMSMSFITDNWHGIKLFQFTEVKYNI